MPRLQGDREGEFRKSLKLKYSVSLVTPQTLGATLVSSSLYRVWLHCDLATTMAQLGHSIMTLLYLFPQNY